MSSPAAQPALRGFNRPPVFGTLANTLPKQESQLHISHRFWYTGAESQREEPVDHDQIPAMPAPDAALQRRVRAFAEATHAQQVILLEDSGHVLTATGAIQQDDVALGALLAGLFGSARQLAEIVGESDFRAMFQQGAQTSIYTMLIGERWLLVTVFGRQAQIGLVRMLAVEAAADLAELLAATEDNLASVRDVVLSAAFRASFDDTLDRLFQDGPVSVQ